MFRKVQTDLLNLRKNPKVDAIFHVTKGHDKAELDVKYINSYKGRGVFAMSAFTKGEFVLECRGQLINVEESQRRQRIYHKLLKAFMFDFLWHGKFWTIDAARDDGTLGRLVNDDHINPNCKMKRIFVEGKPHLCLFALRDITHGEEITYRYRYGDCLWRTQVEKSTDADTNRLESDGTVANDPLSTKCSQYKSPTHIQDVTSSKAHTARFISTNLPHDKLENQLADTVPFESTHVCLQHIGGVDGPDYIASFVNSDRCQNLEHRQTLIVCSLMVPLQMILIAPNAQSANHLPTSRLPKARVATQDLLTENMEDFWKIPWEHNSASSGKPIKLCKVKQEFALCASYRPAERSVCYQYFAVDLMAKCPMPRCILRAFEIADVRDGLSQMISQVQSTDWPEQIALSEACNDFLGQRHKTEVQFDQTGPVTEHRSARAIHFSSVLEMRYKEVADLFQMVKNLRTLRSAMVQKEVQYLL